MSTVGEIIVGATAQGDILHRLIDRRPRCVVSFWHGDPKVNLDDFDERRGDGRCLLAEPGDPAFSRIHYLTEAADHDYMNRVPFWLMAVGRLSPPTTLATGYVHPLLNACSFDLWGCDGSHSTRVFQTDPRLSELESWVHDAEHLAACSKASRQKWSLDPHHPTTAPIHTQAAGLMKLL